MELYISLEEGSLASKIFEELGLRITSCDIYEIVDSCGVVCEDDLDIERLLRAMRKANLFNPDGEPDISSMQIGELYQKESTI